MKIKILILLLIFNLFCNALAQIEVYSKNNKFGLSENGTNITEAKYSKLIKLGKNAYLFLYKNKYGIMDKRGNILINPIYHQAQRFVGKFANLGRNGKYGIFNEYGDTIIDPEYSSIKLLYGKMFLVYKRYKYGIISFDGDILLAPIADDIYMPNENTIKIKYDGIWYTISQEKNSALDLYSDLSTIDIINDDITVSKILQNPTVSAGYGIVNTSDYVIKVFSSISPAYEQTIDELVLNNGADAISILMKCSWLYKFPYVYARNYAKNVKTPNNGPLSEVKIILKNKINKSST